MKLSFVQQHLTSVVRQFICLYPVIRLYSKVCASISCSVASTHFPETHVKSHLPLEILPEKGCGCHGVMVIVTSKIFKCSSELLRILWKAVSVLTPNSHSHAYALQWNQKMIWLWKKGAFNFQAAHLNSFNILILTWISVWSRVTSVDWAFV